MTTNGVLLAGRRSGPAAGRAPSRDGQPRHAAARALRRADRVTTTCRGARRHRGRRRGGIRLSEARHRSSCAASTRTRSCRCSRSAESSRRRGALHRVHGRGRRDRDGGRRTSSRGPRSSPRSLPPTARSTPVDEKTSAPAERFRLADGTVFGIIASTTAPFCRSCDRSRLTADGLWYLCLYATRGADLRGPLRAGASAEELAALIRGGWTPRATIAARRSGSPCATDRPSSAIEELKEDPHLEMHTRGG